MNSGHLVRETMGAMVDGELSPIDAAAAHAHLNECHECSKRVLQLYQLKSAVKQAGMPHAPSPEILARLGAQAGQVRARHAIDQRTRPIPVRSLVLQAAAALLVVALGLGGWRWVRHSDSLAAEVLDEHLAMLSPGSLPEVTSSDRHTVKPWFEGKLPFSFNLPESSALPPDTVLTGADLAYIQGRPAAVLLFSIHKHRTSVFVSQNRPFAVLPHLRTRDGFHFSDAASAGLEFLAVSDANGAEVDALVRSLTAAQ